MNDVFEKELKSTTPTSPSHPIAESKKDWSETNAINEKSTPATGAMLSWMPIVAASRMLVAEKCVYLEITAFYLIE